MIKEKTNYTFYYAFVDDKRVYKEYPNKNYVNSFQEWNFMLEIDKEIENIMDIRKKISGASALLMNMAKKVASVGNYEIKGTIKEFNNKFTVYNLKGEKDLFIPDNLQKLLIQYENCFHDDMSLRILPDGILVSSNVWPNNNSYILCLEELTVKITEIL